VSDHLRRQIADLLADPRFVVTNTDVSVVYDRPTDPVGVIFITHPMDTGKRRIVIEGYVKS
jgi:hypothetical protein